MRNQLVLRNLGLVIVFELNSMYKINDINSDLRCLFSLPRERLSLSPISMTVLVKAKIMAAL